MRETLELTKLGKIVETFFPYYHLTCCWDWNGEITSVEIRSEHGIFSNSFLRFLFKNLENYLITVQSDIAGQPIVKIIEK